MTRIRELAEEKGVTLREVAEMIGCSDIRFMKYVDGKEPALLHQWNLERYFGRSIDYIMGRAEE